jgi:hypothetical protein
MSENEVIVVALGNGMVCIGATHTSNGDSGILLRPTEKPEAIGSTVKTSARIGIFIQCNSLESLEVLERQVLKLRSMIVAKNEEGSSE